MQLALKTRSLHVPSLHSTPKSTLSIPCGTKPDAENGPVGSEPFCAQGVTLGYLLQTAPPANYALWLLLICLINGLVEAELSVAF